VKLKLGVRQWDHVVPIALGDVPSPGLTLTRLESTPDLWTSPDYDGGETSFSR
jgi:4,5-dihydroxyphthalate decarboxylase